DVGEPHQQVVDPAAEVPGGKADRQADWKDDALDEKAHCQRNLAAEHEPAQGVRPRISVPKRWPFTPGGVSMLSTCCFMCSWLMPKCTSRGEIRATPTRKMTIPSPSTASRLRRNRCHASDHSPTCCSGTSQSIAAPSTATTGRAT